jgi:hypothetical protein
MCLELETNLSEICFRNNNAKEDDPSNIVDVPGSQCIPSERQNANARILEERIVNIPAK